MHDVVPGNRIWSWTAGAADTGDADRWTLRRTVLVALGSSLALWAAIIGGLWLIL